MKQVYQLLVDYGVTDQVYIDLGMVKSLEYYTGVVLEGYVPDIGFTLISGGRYDSLSSRFGNQLPAVGFCSRFRTINVSTRAARFETSQQGARNFSFTP